jgi:anaerobic magnesium-protoporphyrin IX monomethyl ester cyclase
MASRGCPFDCSYCASHCIFGHELRRRSPEHIVVEIKHCFDELGIRHFIFYDDNYVVSSNQASEIEKFCNLLLAESLGIFWQVEIRTDVAAQLSSKTLALMSLSGCHQLNMGFEKGTDRGLRGVNKSTTVADSYAAVRNIRSAVPNMRLTGTFILGGPEETCEDIERTIELACELDIDFAHFYPLELYPGTALFQQQMQNGKIPKDWVDRFLDRNAAPWSEVIYETPWMNSRQLLDCVSKAYRRFYRNRKWLLRLAHRTINPVQIGKVLLATHKWQRNRFQL